MEEIIAGAVPFLARPYVKQWFAALSDHERARIDQHGPVALAAAARGGQEGAAAFLSACEAMGVGLFARSLWPLVRELAAKRGG